MELDFQPRKRYRLWEAIWQQIAVMVHRYYGFGTVHSVAEGKVDLEAAAKRGGRRVDGIKTALQKRTREKTYAIDGTSDDSDTSVKAVDSGAVDADSGDEGSEKSKG